MAYVLSDHSMVLHSDPPELTDVISPIDATQNIPAHQHVKTITYRKKKAIGTKIILVVFATKSDVASRTAIAT